MTHSAPLFNELSVLRLSDIYIHQIAVIMNKNYHQQWRGGLSCERVETVHHYKTRLATNDNYFIPTAHNEVFKRSLWYIGPTVWKTIPKDIKELRPHLFKKQFKSFLLKDCV